MHADRDDSKNAPAWNELWVLTALDMNEIGSWNWDFVTNTTQRTAAHDRVFGYDTLLDSWGYADFLRHVIPEDRDNLDALIQNCITEQKPWDFQCRIHRVDGEMRWIVSSGRPISDGSGVVRHYIGTIKDVTDRKLIEKKLAEAQKLEAVGQLTAGVNHHFNNLLAVMMLNIDMLRDVKGVPPEAEKFIQNTMRAVNRGADLTHQLLSFARKWALSPRTVDLNQEVKKIATHLVRILPPTMQVYITTSSQPIPVTVDTGQLSAAIFNIADNARYAMNGGGSISMTVGIEDRETVDSTATQRYGVVTLQDVGCGMPADVAAKAFDPFFTTRDVGQGMGLGLSMVYGFMAQSQGRAELTSVEGDGTTVKMLFPLTMTRPEKVAS